MLNSSEAESATGVSSAKAGGWVYSSDIQGCWGAGELAEQIATSTTGTAREGGLEVETASPAVGP